MNSTPNPMLNALDAAEHEARIAELESRLAAKTDEANKLADEKESTETLYEEGLEDVLTLEAIRDSLTAEALRLAKERDAYRRLANAYRNASDALINIDALRRAELENEKKRKVNE